ncbi:hypothetical protein Ddc_17592 [Ditylenchus destructor]|nr:hypothetical protein Ddc_17592 [Ditylenchus destructor]
MSLFKDEIESSIHSHPLKSKFLETLTKFVKMKFFVYFVLLLSLLYFSTGEDLCEVTCGAKLTERVKKICSSAPRTDFAAKCCTGGGCCDSWIREQCGK